MQKYLSNTRNIIFHKSTNELGNSFVGIKVFNSKIEFFYPESFDIDIINEQQTKEDILSILRTISDRSISDINESTSNQFYKNDSNLAFISYMWLINDYLNNGIYFSNEKILKNKGKGRINWKQTVKRFPIISNSGFIYNSFITEENTSFENILTEVYKYCCDLAFRNLGWLFSIKYTFKSMLHFNKNYFLYIIDSALHVSHDDKRKLMLLNLKNIIQGLNDEYNDSDVFIFGTDKYETVFEKMINDVFSNLDDKTEYFPSGKWKLIGFEKEKKTSNLRPDTIIDFGDSVFIIDSKYYRFGSTNNTNHLPDTTSIQKQITYGEFIKKINKKAIVKNIFILPFNKKIKYLDDSQNIHYFGKAYSSWKVDDNQEHSIYGFFIDLKYLINTYNARNIKLTVKLMNLFEFTIKE